MITIACRPRLARRPVKAENTWMSHTGPASWTSSKLSAAQRIQRLQEMAATRGGQCTVPFSQSLEPVRSWIGLDEGTREGVCRRFVLRWFVEVVKAQPKFWSGVFSETGELNSAFFGTIMTQMLNPGRVNVAAQGEARLAGEDDANLFQPLLSAGFNLTMNNNGSPLTGKNATIAAAEFLAVIVPSAAKHSNFNFCVMLGLKRASSNRGHMVGAMPNADGTILLMDPNLGEFRFPNVDTLDDWMTKDLAPFYNDYVELTYAVFKK